MGKPSHLLPSRLEMLLIEFPLEKKNKSLAATDVRQVYKKIVGAILEKYIHEWDTSGLDDFIFFVKKSSQNVYGH